MIYSNTYMHKSFPYKKAYDSWRPSGQGPNCVENPLGTGSSWTIKVQDSSNSINIFITAHLSLAKTDNLWSWWVYFKHKQILFFGPEVFFFSSSVGPQSTVYRQIPSQGQPTGDDGEPQGGEHSWTQSAMDQSIDTDGIDQYIWSHFH